MITVTTPTGPAQAHVARPTSGSGPWPGVLLFVDAFGLRPAIVAMAERIASWGFVVLTPNVFHDDGTVAQLALDIDMREPGGRQEALGICLPRVKALTPDRSTPDTAAWLDALQQLPDVAAGPVGVTGYCMGARLATRAGCEFPGRVAAVGGFHGGGLATEAADSPHLGLPRARAAFVFGHADHDQSMDAAAVARLGAALQQAGLPHTNHVYPGAAHGYTQSDTDAYDEAASERHFRELRQLFDQTLSTKAG